VWPASAWTRSASIKQLGLIKSAGRSAGGYRLFDGEDIHDLKFVRHAQELRFSLTEVKELLALRQKHHVCSAVQSMLKRKLVDVREKINSRAAQYWDGKRALSHLLGEHNRSSVVWDYIAAYPRGTVWQDAPPKPTYSDGPVRDVISGAKESIKRLLASGTTPAGGGE